MQEARENVEIVLDRCVHLRYKESMITEIRKYMPSFLQKLYQRRLLDRLCDITVDEILEAQRELAEEIAYVQYRVDILNDCLKMLERLQKKKDLM